MKEVMRHLRSFIAPGVVCVILPIAIVLAERGSLKNALGLSSRSLLIISALLMAAGLALLVATIRIFILIGEGTIMPWDPTKKLIVVGMYRYVRNPMILSLIIILAGESILFRSHGIALLAIINFAINTVYFIYSEEPGLEKRFGSEYREYKKNVPRWIPRIKPWEPNEESKNK